jgi:voltage-gated potassium channel Kch
VQAKYPSLTFHESVYWGIVTLTTTGYGDISPSYMTTQIVVIFYFLLMFTVVPYLSGGWVTPGI